MSSFFRPFQCALPPPPHYDPATVAGTKPELPPGITSLKQCKTYHIKAGEEEGAMRDAVLDIWMNGRVAACHVSVMDMSCGRYGTAMFYHSW